MALTDNLQAFYKFSDLSDSSGNNRTLTNNGNVSFASGKIGNAAVFDGENFFNFSVNNTIKTVSCWFKTESQNSYNVLLEFPNAQLQFIGSGQLRVNGQYGEEVFGDDVNDGNWKHAVFVLDENVNSAYLNGTKYLLSTSYTELNSGEITVGATPGGAWDKWIGQIDAVGIWNRALSDSEISELYNNGTGLELDGVAQPTLVKMQAPVKFFGKVKFGV